MNREQLAAIYRDWVNNYLTLAVFAENHGLTESEAKDLLAVCQSCHYNPHPEH